MARTVKEVQQQIYEAVQSDPILGDKLTSPSKFAVWRLFTFVVAVAIVVFEQILDVNTENVEDISRRTPVAISAWSIQVAKEFQYSPTEPQILTLVDNVPFYAVVNEDLRIITSASITNTDFKRNVLKVAKGDITDLQKLDSVEADSMRSYIRERFPVGLVPTLFSEDGDLLTVVCDIYYDGAYLETNVKDDCIDAVLTYLQNLDFGGNIVVNSIIDAIQSVQGVSDVVIDTILIRDYTQDFGGGSTIVSSKCVIEKSVSTTAGYVKEETTGGFSFNDTFTMKLK